MNSSCSSEKSVGHTPYFAVIISCVSFHYFTTESGARTDVRLDHSIKGNHKIALYLHPLHPTFHLMHSQCPLRLLLG